MNPPLASTPASANRFYNLLFRDRRERSSSYSAPISWRMCGNSAPTWPSSIKAKCSTKEAQVMLRMLSMAGCGRGPSPKRKWKITTTTSMSFPPNWWPANRSSTSLMRAIRATASSLLPLTWRMFFSQRFYKWFHGFIASWFHC